MKNLKLELLEAFYLLCLITAGYVGVMVDMGRGTFWWIVPGAIAFYGLILRDEDKGR